MYDEHRITQPKQYQWNEIARVRRLLIGSRLLLGFFEHKRLDRDWLELLEYDLPEGFKVVAMSYIACPPCLVLYIEHPSFDPVPIGDLPPNIELKVETVALKKVPKVPLKLQSLSEPNETIEHLPSYDTYRVIDRKESISSTPTESPTPKRSLRERIYAALKKLNVTVAGHYLNTNRWSAGDLATDLAVELEKESNQ